MATFDGIRIVVGGKDGSDRSNISEEECKFIVNTLTSMIKSCIENGVGYDKITGDDIRGKIKEKYPEWMWGATVIRPSIHCENTVSMPNFGHVALKVTLDMGSDDADNPLINPMYVTVYKCFKTPSKDEGKLQFLEEPHLCFAIHMQTIEARGESYLRGLLEEAKEHAKVDWEGEFDNDHL